MNTLNKKDNIIFTLACWLSIVIGILLRLVQYFSDRSLWRDEARIALNVIEKSFLELTQPLNYDQTAPIGFLLTEKLITSVLGTSEYAFRLFPLICGIGSLFLFYSLAKKFLSLQSASIACWLFAITVHLIYYSSEAKQYSSDLFIALLLISSVTNLNIKEFNLKRSVLIGLTGAILIWISHPCIFVLASIFIFLLIFYKNNNSYKFICLLILGALWSISFWLTLKISVNTILASKSLNNFFEGNYMPLPLLSDKNILWFPTAWSGLLSFLGIDRWVLILFIAGIIFSFKKSRTSFSIFFFPILFVLIATGFHKYPFAGRFLLFTVPAIIFFICCGIEFLRTKVFPDFPFITVLVTIFVLYQPVINAKDSFLYPATKEEIKPALSYLKQHRRSGDVIYVNGHLQFAFKYYAKKYGFDDDFNYKKDKKSFKKGCYYRKKDYVLFIDPYPREKEECSHLFDKVKGEKRVWIMYSTYVDKPICSLDTVFKLLDSLGLKLDSFFRPGIKLYLYDLSNPT